MTKPEWGTKRECTDCGARFYDMGKDPIVCPKCEAIVTPESAKLTRAEARAKAKQEAQEKSKAEEAKAAATKAEDAGEGDEADALLQEVGIDGDNDDDEEEEDAGLIEGGFDLNGGDDVADVVDAPTGKTDDT